MTVRLHFVVEGQSEETFVNRVLAPHLLQYSVLPDARCVYTSRDGAYWKRGGVTRFARLHRDLTSWMKQDQRPDARFTTMLDVYGLPADFPGYDSARKNHDPYAIVGVLEQALTDEISDSRLLSYFQLFEFEALILAEPAKLKTMYPGNEKDIDRLVDLRNRHESPETINFDAPPSKRIMDVIPAYSKTAAAAQVTLAIGIDTIRGACPHFNEWLTKLERLHA